MARDTVPAEFRPKFLDTLDGRTQTAKVLRQRLADLVSDLGGESRLSYAKRSLCRRAIWLEAWIETQEASAAEGEDVAIGQQVQAVNALIGILKTLGLDREAAEVPTLTEYLAAKAAEKAKGAGDE